MDFNFGEDKNAKMTTKLLYDCHNYIMGDLKKPFDQLDDKTKIKWELVAEKFCKEFYVMIEENEKENDNEKMERQDIEIN